MENKNMDFTQIDQLRAHLSPIDGNGKNGRLILNLELIKTGMLPVKIKFAGRRKYYDCLESYHSGADDAEAFIELIAGYEIEELERHIKILEM